MISLTAHPDWCKFTLLFLIIKKIGRKLSLELLSFYCVWSKDKELFADK